MDKRAAKLNHYIGDIELATELVALGLDTPRKIKATSNLVKIIGKSKADRVRGKIK